MDVCLFECFRIFFYKVHVDFQSVALYSNTHVFGESKRGACSNAGQHGRGGGAWSDRA